jgi:hypothetical protein
MVIESNLPGETRLTGPDTRDWCPLTVSPGAAGGRVTADLDRDAASGQLTLRVAYVVDDYCWTTDFVRDEKSFDFKMRGPRIETREKAR